MVASQAKLVSLRPAGWRRPRRAMLALAWVWKARPSSVWMTGGGEFSFEIDVQKVAQVAFNVGQDALKASSDVADQAGDAVGQMVEAVTRLAHQRPTGQVMIDHM